METETQEVEFDPGSSVCFPSIFEAMIQGGFTMPSRENPSLVRQAAMKRMIAIQAEERALLDRLNGDRKASLSSRSLKAGMGFPEQKPPKG